MARKTPKWERSNLTDEAFLDALSRRNVLTLCGGCSIVECHDFQSLDDAYDVNKFPFWKLPPELRDLVYRHALDGIRMWSKHDEILSGRKATDIQITYEHQATGRVHAQRELPVWLRYNNRLRQEALAQFYSRAQFFVHHSYPLIEPVHSISTPPGFTKISRTLDLPLLQHARNVVLDAEIRTYEHSTGAGKPKRCEVCQNVLGEGKAATMCWWLRRNCTSLKNLELHLTVTDCYRPKIPSVACQWCALWHTIPNQLWRQRTVFTTHTIGLGRVDVNSSLQRRLIAVVKEATRGNGQDGDVRVTVGEVEINGWFLEWCCESTTASYRRSQTMGSGWRAGSIR